MLILPEFTLTLPLRIAYWDRWMRCHTSKQRFGGAERLSRPKRVELLDSFAGQVESITVTKWETVTERVWQTEMLGTKR